MRRPELAPASILAAQAPVAGPTTNGSAAAHDAGESEPEEDEAVLRPHFEDLELTGRREHAASDPTEEATYPGWWLDSTPLPEGSPAAAGALASAAVVTPPEPAAPEPAVPALAPAPLAVAAPAIVAEPAPAPAATAALAAMPALAPVVAEMTPIAPADPPALPEPLPAGTPASWHLGDPDVDDEEWPPLVAVVAPPVEPVAAGSVASRPGPASNGTAPPAPAAGADPAGEQPAATPAPGPYPAKPDRYEIF